MIGRAAVQTVESFVCFIFHAQPEALILVKALHLLGSEGWSMSGPCCVSDTDTLPCGIGLCVQILFLHAYVRDVNT